MTPRMTPLLHVWRLGAVWSLVLLAKAMVFTPSPDTAGHMRSNWDCWGHILNGTWYMYYIVGGECPGTAAVLVIHLTGCSVAAAATAAATATATAAAAAATTATAAAATPTQETHR